MTGVVIAFAVIFFLMWNKAPRKAEDEKGIPVSAVALSAEFGNDEAGANAKYLKKVLEVSGTISEVSNNQDGQTVALLQADDPIGGVQCTMRDKGVSLQTGQQVTVKGFCNGYTMVVLLSDCILKK